MRGFFARAFQAGWGKRSMRGFRTDLAMESIDEGGGRVEGVRVSTHHLGGITHTRIRIEKERAAELLGRHTGEYITLEYRDLPRCDAHTQKLLAALVAQGVRSLLPREGEVGWTLVTHAGLPLGWGKQAGGMLKNHVPKGLRARLHP